MPEKLQAKSKVENLVAPVESVETKATDPCWNCNEQLTDNKCKECGFDKALLYNLELEAEKAAKRESK